VLIENTLFGERDKVKIAIDRLQAFEPPEGYYLAFSGGKDSQCIYHLAKEAGVKFDAHYNLTTVDPPELIYFMRENYPDVIIDRPQTTIWRLIEKRGLPTRMARFCCSELKEHGGQGRICVTGVRWAESARRKNSRNTFEVVRHGKGNSILFNDNDDGRLGFENCVRKGKRVVNPIIDWSDEDVWDYLNNGGIKHCCLYDEGFTRLGCIGCPLSANMARELLRYPKFSDAYKRALERHIKHREKTGRKQSFKTVDDYWNWWLKSAYDDKAIDGQESLDTEV